MVYQRRGFGEDSWWGNVVSTVGSYSSPYVNNLIADSVVLARAASGQLPRTMAEVMALQRALNHRNSSLPTLVVDGQFGPRTQARLAEYVRQARQGSSGGSPSNLPPLPTRTPPLTPQPQSSNMGLYIMLGLALVAVVALKG
jgi:peptidoglycan hydrolase-like protein with peptidoglycan-binding domain